MADGVEKVATGMGYVTVGHFMGQRLKDAGVRTIFGVPGNYNMLLLDELLKTNSLKLVGCCNELNAGYAADGTSRSSGTIGVVVVTYMVGALSVINAVAGAFSEDIPLLVIVGSPNSHDIAERNAVHHSLRIGSMTECMRSFESIVAQTFAIHHAEEAPGKCHIFSCGNCFFPLSFFRNN
jgi:pyruvate decarboxylase